MPDRKQGYTFQTNRKGVVAIEVDPPPVYPKGNHLRGVFKDTRVTYIPPKEFFEDPEKAREALLAYHEANLQKHQENAAKSVETINKVKAQVIKQ